MQSEQPVAGTAGAGGRDRLSAAAFVVGLVSALTGVLYFVAVPVGLVGLVMGILAIRRPGSVKRLALGGVMLSVVGLVVGLGVVAFLVLEDDNRGGALTVIDGIESGSDDTEHPPQHDLHRDVTCLVEIDALRASGHLTNRTDTVASYQLIATWERNGREIAESTAIVDAVPPGGTRLWDVTAVGDDAPGITTCRVLRIDRSSG